MSEREKKTIAGGSPSKLILPTVTFSSVKKKRARQSQSCLFKKKATTNNALQLYVIKINKNQQKSVIASEKNTKTQSQTKEHAQAQR